LNLALFRPAFWGGQRSCAFRFAGVCSLFALFCRLSTREKQPRFFTGRNVSGYFLFYLQLFEPFLQIQGKIRFCR
jgi:hypothetical protein